MAIAWPSATVASGIGTAEAGEHAHRPQPAAVAGRMDATRERRLAGQPQVVDLEHRQGIGLFVGGAEPAIGDFRRELDANPRAALCVYWQPLERQVRVEE